MALKLGFIGGGLNSAVGYTHYLAARMDGEFDIVAGCFSRSEQVNTESAAAFGVDPARTYATQKDLFCSEAGTLDAVCILTPTPDHAKTAGQALEAGFNVICEKALATSVAECGLISEAQRASNRFFGVTFNYAGYPMVREARQMILSGELGAIQQLHCEMPQESFSRQGADPQLWRRSDYEIPCVSLDLGVHVHHLVCYITGGGQLTGAVSKQATYGLVPNVIDTVFVLANHNQDTTVSMMWSKAALGYRNGLRFRVMGEKGSIEWLQSDPENLILARKNGERYTIDRGQGNLREAGRDRYNRFKSGHPAGFIEAFANLYLDFSYALTTEITQEHNENFSIDAATAGITFLQDEVHKPQ